MARVIETGSNRATSKEAASFVCEYDRCEREREVQLLELDHEFKKRKREINKKVNVEQKKLLDDAKSQGVQKGIIRGLAAQQKDLRKARQIEEKAMARVDDLDDDDREYAVSIRDAIGEDFITLPLGAAAVAAEEEEPRQDETTAAIVDAVLSDN